LVSQSERLPMIIPTKGALILPCPGRMKPKSALV
jgi:hypothetical protein